MKSKLTICVLLFLLTLAFIYNTSNETKIITAPLSTTGFTDSFFIGLMDGGVENGYDKIRDTLNTNLWTKYTEHWNNFGWNTYHNGYVKKDSLTADLNSGYISYVNGVISTNGNEHMRSLMQRIKLEYLAYGQRSDYQCEPIPESDDYGFYSYSTHQTGIEEQDISPYGYGQKVMHCRTEPENSHDNPGYVIKDLKANREQVNTIPFSSSYSIDYKFKWYIKPRIRIDSGFANNPANWNKNVCRIEVLNWYGDTIKDVDIKVRNFKQDQLTQYLGYYLEEYHFLPWDDFDTLIVGPGKVFNPNDSSILNTNCKVDFRVWWYGNCDMWIDYVRVDNEIAHDLFRGVYTDPQFQKEWLKWEVQDIALQNSSPLKFYIEEFEFNNVPCISYVNEKIKELSSNKYSLSVVLNYGEFAIIHRPDIWSAHPGAEYIKRTLIDSTGIEEIIGFAYPFDAYDPNSLLDYQLPQSSGQFTAPTYIPNTLHKHDFNMSEGRMSRDTFPWATITGFKHI